MGWLGESSQLLSACYPEESRYFPALITPAHSKLLQFTSYYNKQKTYLDWQTIQSNIIAPQSGTCHVQVEEHVQD